MSERLFRYAVLLQPTSEERKAGKKADIVVPPTKFFLAANENEVVMLASREVPQEYMDKADRLEVAVRPF